MTDKTDKTLLSRKNTGYLTNSCPLVANPHLPQHPERCVPVVLDDKEAWQWVDSRVQCDGGGDELAGKVEIQVEHRADEVEGDGDVHQEEWDGGLDDEGVEQLLLQVVGERGLRELCGETQVAGSAEAEDTRH